LAKKLWFRLSGMVVVTVAVAALMAAFLGASAAAGPSTATARLAGQRTVVARTGHAGNGVLLSAQTSNAAVARAASQTLESAVVAGLSARQLAGQRVIYGYSGLTPPASLLSLIRHGEAGGVIFFAGNYKNRSQFAAAVKKLENANLASTNLALRQYPLLLMTDQEGGQVRRLPGAPIHSQKWIGDRTTASNRAYQARKAGSGAAANLLSYGLNVNLAPVLDVYRTAGDFDDQFQRSYSMSAPVVSTLGATFIKAQQAGGVAATAKHFPGLGAATARQNTDERPVTLNLSKATIQNKDEYPYRAAISAGVDLVMVSWAKYPRLGSSRPAGLSSVIVQGQLRTRLKFQGVTITDAIGAGALAPYGSTQSRALLAAQAGMQLILASSSVTQATQCLTALEGGYEDGKLPATVFQATVSQILMLRASLQP
jgi:beta-N-acetylhexosaminidase